MLIVVVYIDKIDKIEPVVVFIVYQAARMGAPRGLGRPNCSPFLFPADPLLPGQTRPKRVGALVVALDALLVACFLAYCSMSCLILFRDLLRSILGSQADPPTFKHDGCAIGILSSSTKRRSRSEPGVGNCLGLSRNSFGSSGACLGDSLGPLAQPKRVSRFILDLYWALFARFLLLTMVSGLFPFLWELLGVDFELPS